MSTVVEHRKFSLTNLGNNNNKFWNVTLYDNNDVMSQWGRQGDSGQSKTWYGAGRSLMDRKIREKGKKGYKENKVAESSSTASMSSVRVASSQLKDIAKKQIKSTCKLAQDLIDYLVKVNAHNILNASGGKITYDTSTAQFKTTQGVIMPEQVATARDLLSDLSILVRKNDFDNWQFADKLNEYLSYIPRDFGRKRMSILDILGDMTDVQKENDILDSLDASFSQIITTPKNKTKKKKDSPAIFKVEMKLVTNKKTISKIRKMYQDTRKRNHTSNNLSIKDIYSIDIESMRKAYDGYGAKLSNKKQLWHGTKASNLLSIMRKGLIIPPSSSAHCTGRMYGNGLYFSSISTKALNYATNFWGRGGDTSRTFMFLSDVAMGKTHIAGRGWGSFPVRGYDSTWAKGGQSGVINDEMIVYKLNQANLVYLVEFADRKY
jgi:poly [ADP-ribose] polymerase 2/3/4